MPRRVPRPVDTSIGPKASPVWGPRCAKPDLQPDDRLIGTAEAADILGITRGAVCNLVRRGLIPAWQKCAGKAGSPLQLSLHYVERLLDRPDYQRMRANFAQGQQTGGTEMTKGYPEYEIEPGPERGHTEFSARDRGIFVTVRQAADILGIRREAVCHLIWSGRLRAERRKQKRRRNAVGELQFAGGNRWWFIRKKDLDALMADPEYIKNHRRWWKSAQPEAREARQQAEEEKVMEQFMRLRRRKPCGWTSRANWRDTGWVWGIGPDWELPRIGHDPMSPPAGLLTPDEMKEALVNGPTGLEDLLWSEWGCI